MILNRTNGLIAAAAAALIFNTSATALDRSPAPENSRVYIISPANGETLSSPVTVIFGLAGMGVAPAGVDSEHTGHHHLIINSPLPDPSLPIPADDNHKHFGKGQTQTTIELAPGKHKLQLLMGNMIHVPHDPVISSKVVEITIK